MESGVKMGELRNERVKVRSEERLFPLLRAGVAERLLGEGFRVKEIATVLNVTPAAVTQYTKGRRGNKLASSKDFEQVIKALAGKAAQRIRSTAGPLEIVELVDAGYQIMAATKGQRVLESKFEESRRQEWVIILKERLQLELNAAQKCLALANHTQDDYSKLLMRMIASDSVRHADIASQLLSWLEVGHEPAFDPPPRQFLDEMMRIEDKSSESSLTRSIRLPPSVARLLLESIDMDEKKHERLLAKLLKIVGNSSVQSLS